MAQTSYGYPGVVAPGATWARLMTFAQFRYWCYNETAVRVLPLGTGTREVTIGAGWFGGMGIVDYCPGGTVQLPTVTAGTRYFLVVARRVWGADAASSSTTFATIDAGTTPVVPGRTTIDLTDPALTGSNMTDDQPLALVPLTAGNTVPGTPTDLRLIGVDGELVASSDLVMAYMTWLGAKVRIGTNRWHRTLNASGVAGWEKTPGPYGRVALTSVPLVGGSASGWSASGQGSRVLTDGNEVHVDFATRRSGANIPVSATGNVVDTPVITFANVPLPTIAIPVPLIYYNNGGSVSGMGILYPTGEFKFVAGSPNTPLTQTTDTTATSLRCAIHYTRETV